MSHGRSEPAGLHGLCKQGTEAKEGPLEFREKKEKGGRKGEKVLTHSRERKCAHLGKEKGRKRHSRHAQEKEKVHAGYPILRICIHFLKTGI